MSYAPPQKYEPMSVDDNGAGESFIATGTAVDAPTPEAEPYLEVAAPATLPEGYTFEAEANGQAFTVKVPVGGVEEGQTFSVPFPAGANGYSGAAMPRSPVPVGHWKDDMCACCGLGCCHVVLWNAYCCPMILLGQVMHRLKLTWCADEGGTVGQIASTFRILFGIGIGSLVLHVIYYLLPLAMTDDKVQISDGVAVLWSICRIAIIAFAILRVILICKTRQHIRSKYNIPEQQCHGCEDCCCAHWCSCCTVAQMARHTGDYKTYRGMCCSETGMPPHAPPIV